jgi:hypothetical protein
MPAGEMAGVLGDGIAATAQQPRALLRRLCPMLVTKVPGALRPLAVVPDLRVLTGRRYGTPEIEGSRL